MSHPNATSSGARAPLEVPEYRAGYTPDLSRPFVVRGLLQGDRVLDSWTAEFFEQPPVGDLVVDFFSVSSSPASLSP